MSDKKRRIIRMSEVHLRSGLSATEVRRREKAGVFPQSFHLGESVSSTGEIVQSKLRGWWEDEIDGWVEDRAKAASMPSGKVLQAQH